MAVKTHSMNKPFAQDRDPHGCEFCDRDATFWSQNEEGEKALGPSVFHCRTHRQQGRDAAATLPLPTRKLVLAVF